MGGYSAIMVTKKSVTKNATFPRTEGLPCLTTRQLHVSQLLGDSFSVSQRPPICDSCSHSSMVQLLGRTHGGAAAVLQSRSTPGPVLSKIS